LRTIPGIWPKLGTLRRPESTSAWIFSYSSLSTISTQQRYESLGQTHGTQGRTILGKRIAPPLLTGRSKSRPDEVDQRYLLACAHSIHLGVGKDSPSVQNPKSSA